MDKKILVVEDDPEMIELSELFLHKAGYQVLAARDGRTGLKMLGRESVDLVLLDIMMCGLDGWGVLKAMRANEQWQDIPVIVLSARHHLAGGKERAAQAEMFTDYVVKPFIVQDLLKRIEAALVV